MKKIITITLLLFFISCSDDNDDKSIYILDEVDITYDDVKNNNKCKSIYSNNLLTKIECTDKSIDYEYENNKIVSVITTTKTYYPFIEKYKTIYEYSGENIVLRKKFYENRKNNERIISKTLFYYNSSNHLSHSRGENYDDNGAIDFETYTSYEPFFSNPKKISINVSSYRYRYEYHITYDDKKHPRFNEEYFRPILKLEGNPTFNNPIKRVYLERGEIKITNNYTNKYNSDGLLINQTTETNSPHYNSVFPTVSNYTYKEQ